jgi:hypothetical protein
MNSNILVDFNTISACLKRINIVFLRKEPHSPGMEDKQPCLAWLHLNSEENTSKNYYFIMLQG